MVLFPVGEKTPHEPAVSVTRKVEADIPTLTRSAETLLKDIDNPEGIKALRELIDRGFYKEAGIIMAKIMGSKTYNPSKIIPEDQDKLYSLFAKLFLPNADPSENINTDKIFQVIKFCSRQQRLITHITSWLNSINKQNAAEIIKGRIQHSSLFESLGVEDEDGDTVIGPDEKGYASIKGMDKDGNGVTIEEIAAHAVTQPDISYSKNLVDSIRLKIKEGMNIEKYLGLLEAMSQKDAYAKLRLAEYYLETGQYKKGIVLLHEYITQNPDIEDLTIIEDYQTFLEAFGLKEDLSNIDDPNNNIQFFEDLAYYYRTFHSPGKSAEAIPLFLYSDSYMSRLKLNTVQAIKDLVLKISEEISRNPSDEKLQRLKTKLELYIKEYETTKGAGQIRMFSSGKPLDGNLTITDLEQTVTIMLPSRWTASINLECSKYQYSDHVFYDYMYSEGKARPLESGNPLMVKVEIPMWKFLKLISPGEKSVKVQFEFKDDTDSVRTTTLNITIPPAIWATRAREQPTAQDLYGRMFQDVLTHYQGGQDGPAVWQGSFVINADKDHPELSGKGYTKDRFYNPAMDSSPLHALEADGFKCVQVITERPTEPPKDLEKPDTPLPDTSYTIENGQIVQKWGYPVLGDKAVVLSPREIRVYEKRVFPKDMKGDLKAQFEKLPPDIKARIAKEGIVMRITVPFYTDTYAGTTYYHQRLLDDKQFFIGFQTHLPFSQSYVVEGLVSSPDYNPRTEPGMVVAIHCDSGATTTPYANVYGNLITTPGPKDKTYGNPYPATFVLRAIMEGRSTDGLEEAAIEGQAHAQRDPIGKVRGVWTKPEEATGGHIKDEDIDGLPDAMDPNPDTPNVYYYDKLHFRLVIYNPVTDKEVVLRNFTPPKESEGYNYSAFNPTSINAQVIKRAVSTLALYQDKKQQARLAYLESLEERDTQTAKPTE